MKLTRFKFIKIMHFSKNRSQNESRDFNELAFICGSSGKTDFNRLAPGDKTGEFCKGVTLITNVLNDFVF